MSSLNFSLVVRACLLLATVEGVHGEAPQSQPHTYLPDTGQDPDLGLNVKLLDFFNKVPFPVALRR